MNLVTLSFLPFFGLVFCMIATSPLALPTLKHCVWTHEKRMVLGVRKYEDARVRGCEGARVRGCEGARVQEQSESCPSAGQQGSGRSRP